MRRAFVGVMLCVTAFPAEVLGGARIRVLRDNYDSFQSVRVAQMYPEVAEQAQTLDRFLETIMPRTLAEVEQGLGQPAGSSPDSTYAMPLCQSRQVAFGGFGRPTIRPEFYPIDLMSGLQVWYFPDSTTVSTMVVYLKVDSLFTPYNRQTQNDFGTRFSWDRDRLTVVEQTLRRRFGERVPPNSVLQPRAPHDKQR